MATVVVYMDTLWMNLLALQPQLTAVALQPQLSAVAQKTNGTQQFFYYFISLPQKNQAHYSIVCTVFVVSNWQPFDKKNLNT